MCVIRSCHASSKIGHCPKKHKFVSSVCTAEIISNCYGTSGPVKYQVLPRATELDIYMLCFRPKKLQSQIFLNKYHVWTWARRVGSSGLRGQRSPSVAAPITPAANFTTQRWTANFHENCQNCKEVFSLSTFMLQKSLRGEFSFSATRVHGLERQAQLKGDVFFNY